MRAFGWAACCRVAFVFPFSLPGGFHFMNLVIEFEEVGACSAVILIVLLLDPTLYIIWNACFQNKHIRKALIAEAFNLIVVLLE